MTALRPALRFLAPALVAAALLALGSVAATPARAAPAHRVMLAGDSVTQGSAGDYTWRYRLWTKLGRTAPGQVAFVGPRAGVYDQVGNTQNRGFYAVKSFSGKSHAALWGTTFDAQMPWIRGQVTDARATTLVVLLGFNDLAWLGKTPAQTITSLEQYVARARLGNPRLRIVLGQLLKAYDPWTGAVRFGPEIDAFNRALPGVASRLSTANSRIVVASTANGWNPNGHTWDGTHPNPTGETLIAQRVSEALATLGIGTAAPNIHATTAWRVRGPKPLATPGPRSATLRWDRVPTGANAMYVQQRVTTPRTGPWQTLPYPVSGDAFAANLLTGGAVYQFRVAPAKGLMKGQVGYAASVRTGL